MKLQALGLSMAAVAVLASCGGAEDTPPAPPTASELERVEAPLAVGPIDHHRAQFRVERGKFSWVGSTPVATRLPRLRGRTQPRAWAYQALDPDGAVLLAGSLDDPRWLRGEFHGDAKVPTVGHHMRTEATEFLIRIPRGTRRVVFTDDGGLLGAVDVPAQGAP